MINNIKEEFVFTVQSRFWKKKLIFFQNSFMMFLSHFDVLMLKKIKNIFF
jgi:hypothetical protein